MNFLLSQLNAADRAAINESNAQTLDESPAFMHKPSIDPATQAPTANPGPPTTGDWPEFSLWVDALCALWRCTTAGTPGTWIQIQPAVVDAEPTGTIPDNYLIVMPSQKWAQFYYDGTDWQPVNVQPQ